MALRPAAWRRGGWSLVAAGLCLAVLAAGIAHRAVLAGPGSAPVVPPSPAMVALGGALFRRPLSADGRVACASCHVPALGFSGATPRAVGSGGFTAARRAPALLDLRDAHALMWDGRAAGLSAQVPMPLASPEMAVDWPAALAAANADPDLSGLAARAGSAPLDRARVVAALVAYVASLESGTSRFDSFHDGGNREALTDQERLGYRLFVRKANCGSCHLATGPHPRFTDDAFHSVGIGEGDASDPGRAGVTGAAADRWLFRTPSLRDVARRPYLMHDGSMTDLRQVVRYYNGGGHTGSAIQDPRIVPLHLEPSEIEALVAFLGTLDERQ